MAKSRKLEELMAILIQIRVDPTSEALAVLHTDTMRRSATLYQIEVIGESAKCNIDCSVSHKIEYEQSAALARVNQFSFLLLRSPIRG
jgi:uncharacterized protein with HEPN domain